MGEIEEEREELGEKREEIGVLERAGLNKNEARVYLALLEIGESTAWNIAKKSKVHRTNVYDALEGLIKKGLVAHIIKEKTKFFKASSPLNLLNIERERELAIKKIIPLLLARQRIKEEKQEVYIHEGARAFIQILYHFLDYKEPILVYGAPKEAYEILKPKITHFHKERIKRKIVMKHIYNFDATERIKQLKKMMYTPVRRMPELYNSQVSTNICGEEVAFVFFGSSMKTVWIKDKEIANAYKKYFELLWKNAR